jgi:hypothetical protein
MTQFCSLIQKKPDSELHNKLKASLMEISKGDKSAMTPSFRQPLRFLQNNFVLGYYRESEKEIDHN